MSTERVLGRRIGWTPPIFGWEYALTWIEDKRWCSATRYTLTVKATTWYPDCGYPFWIDCSFRYEVEGESYKRIEAPNWSIWMRLGYFRLHVLKRSLPKAIEEFEQKTIQMKNALDSAFYGLNHYPEDWTARRRRKQG